MLQLEKTKIIGILRGHACIENPIRIQAFDLNEEYPGQDINKVVIQIHTKEGEVQIGCLDILIDTKHFILMYEQMGLIYAHNKAAIQDRIDRDMSHEEMRSESTSEGGKALVLHTMHNGSQKEDGDPRGAQE